MKTRLGALTGICAAALTLGSAVEGSAAVEPGSSGTPFCRGQVAHDYAAPLRSMPRLHQVPPSGQLPFAPPNTFLKPPVREVFVPNGSGRAWVSYGFSATPGHHRVFRLGWQIQLDVYRVNEQGQPVELVAKKLKQVGIVGEATFDRIRLAAALPAAPGFYRADLVFAKKGRRLARYGKYMRVVRPATKVGMLGSTSEPAPGAELLVRVANYGTEAVIYGEPLKIEQRQGDRWVYYPIYLGPWHRIRIRLLGGGLGSCESVSLPSDLPAGKYRVTKRLAIPARVVSWKFRIGGTKSAFCGVDVPPIKDYLRPFEGLAKLREFSVDGRLGVGPPALRIFRPESHLISIGYGGVPWRSGLDGSVQQKHRLDWRIITRLEKINREGELVRVAIERRQVVATVRKFMEARFGFRGSIPRGLYRFTFEIDNLAGKRLERRQEYLRALPARSELKLGISPSTLHPGESAELRFENLGTIATEYRSNYRLVKSVGVEIPTGAIFPKVLVRLQPGYASGCFSFQAPADIPPGRYTIVSGIRDPLRGHIEVSSDVTIE